MGKVLLFYKYVDIKYPKGEMATQQALCTELGLTGRIILAHEGINGSLGGTDEATQRYKEVMSQHELFHDIDFKESEGGADCFPRLRIVVRDEVVTMRQDTKKYTHADGGKHLKPHETHALIEEKPEDLVILDARNAFEAEIGRFTNAVIPNIKNFRDFPDYIDQNLDLFKDKQVLMYCTGGIRCERASAYLTTKGVAKKVYQMEGGIHKYVEQYPDGFFRGKNYVFDARVALKVNDDILGSCGICKKSTDEFNNCMNAVCNKHFVCCSECRTTYLETCSTECKELVLSGKTHKRPTFTKIEINQ